MTSIDAAEACITTKLVTDITTMASQPTNPLGADHRFVGPAVATRVVAAPSSVPHNKARAFGRGALDGLAEIEAFFAEVGQPSRIEVSTTATDHAAHLAAVGYEQTSASVLLTRPLTGSDGQVTHAVTIQAIGADDGAYLDVIRDGYELAAGSAAMGLFTVEHRTSGLRRHVVVEAGEPVAAGALHIDSDRALGYLAGATTLTAHRRRGHQGSLIHSRLGVAARAGCTAAIVTAAPGSPSHANLARHGFTELHGRQLWERRV